MKQDKASYSPPPFYHFIMVLTLLLAVSLRFYKLDAQSFWNDEGNTARLVERTIPLIIEGAAGDVHPPGYYLLLHGWRLFMGESEFALRAYSAFCSVITIALTAAIAQHLIGGRKQKSWAMILPALWYIALHPLAVYYSQEARMYAQLGMAASSMLWAALLLQKTMSLQLAQTSRRQRLTRFFFLAVTVAAGLYTHYAFIFAVISLSCAYGVFWLIHGNKNWRALAAWIGAFVMGGLLFLPWAPTAIRASGWNPPDLGTAHALRAMARTLVVGVTSPEHQAAYILPLLGLIGALILWKLPRARFSTWAAFTMAFLPMVLFASFGFYRPAYLKFLIISLSPLALCLTALLSEWLPVHLNLRWTTALIICLLLIFTPAQVTALQHLYNDPAYARDDYRGIAAFIEMAAQPGDAVLLNAPNQWEVFTYYYRGDLPVYTGPYRPDRLEAAAWVADIVVKHSQLFALYWGDTEADPGRFIETALAQQAYKANEMWVSSVRLVRYGTGPKTAAPTALSDIVLGPNDQVDRIYLTRRPPVCWRNPSHIVRLGGGYNTPGALQSFYPSG